MFLLEEKADTSQKTLVVPRHVSIPDKYGKITNMIEVEGNGPILEFRVFYFDQHWQQVDIIQIH